MSTEAKTEKIDIKKELGNPKITFVVGGPGSGKGTQCAKLVEEFGYTHISTGDLMRTEMKKGSREGDRIRKIVTEGGLVPYELTVQVLINALIAQPSQNYLIDGFPRALDQAMYFEQNVCQAQSVLYFNVSEDTCLQRCLDRGSAGSGRTDDNEAAIKKRLTGYNEQTAPVIEMYRRFGKVKEIDGNRDELQVYEDTRRLMLPQVSCIIGPQASGKSTLGRALCERTNMRMINFNDFVRDNKLQGKDDETVTMALIKQLSHEITPRVLLEDFPKNEFQAKFFIKNCVTPSRVFVLKCSKDVCQERMTKLGQDSDAYQASTILAKKIRAYNEDCQKLLPYLESSTNLRIVDTEQTLSSALTQINSHVEPQIIHVRVGGSETAQASAKAITDGLIGDQKFFELDVNSLIRDETERRTDIGCEIQHLVSAGQIISPELIVRMLKLIVYNGQEGNDKFLLSGFPDTNEGVDVFEADCAKITAVIYASGPEPVVEIMNNNLNLFNIDSLFQKEFRLKTMKEWDSRSFEEQLGSRTEWGIISGCSLTGKTTVAGMIAGLNRGKILNMAVLSEECKKRLGTEDEPFEGDVPLAEVEKDVVALVEADKAASEQFTYIFDGYTHTSAEEFVKWFSGHFGSPSFILKLQADKPIIEDRYRKRNEVEGEELNEDQQAELAEMKKKAETEAKQFAAAIAECGGKTQEIELSTDASLESTLETLRSKFCAKVILVNHEKRLPVDTACCNLAIKYNMLYLSVYQLIKEQISKNTKLGQALAASKKPKALVNLNPTGAPRDAFEEAEYSAVHFDLPIVMQLIQETIMEKRTNQSFILLEGLCNSSKLAQEDDRLEMRQMDELFSIEKSVGEVSSVISLVFNEEATQVLEEQKEYEQFEQEEVKEEKPKVEGEDGEEAPAEEEPAEGDDGEPKKPAFKPEDYKWTITNGCPKNLPQLFRDFKGGSVIDDKKSAQEFSSSSQFEAIAKSLDQFCGRLQDDAGARSFYQQIIFQE